MRKRCLAILLSAALVVSMAACGSGSGSGAGTGGAVTAADSAVESSAEKAEQAAGTEAGTEAGAEAGAAAESTTKVFTDSTGREVEVPTEIKKVAVSGPLTQIIVYSFAPELLVGFSSDWSEAVQEYIPEEYLKLPVLGQLYGGKGELNLEELLKADPDVVLDVGEGKDSIKEDMEQLQEQTGIPFIHIDASTADTGDAYRKLGELLGLEDRAAEYADYYEEIYTQAEEIADAAGDDKKKVLYCLGENGLNVIAKDSYHSEVIDLLCDNQAVVAEPSSKGSGNEVDMEQILNWNPEVILFAPDSIYSDVENRPEWKQITAIQNGDYYEVPFGPYNWMGFPPSVQRCLGMLWLGKILYTEEATYDLKKEVVRYYKMFYHVELSDGQYEKLMANAVK